MPLSTQFFDTLISRFERDGIPTTREEVAETVMAVTGQDVLRYLSGEMVTFSSIPEVTNAYADHRASHRIAAFRDHVAQTSNMLFLGRQTQNQPSRMWPHVWDVLGQIDRYYRSGAADILKNMPWVISEEGRFDRAPMSNDLPEQHATLHLMCYEEARLVDTNHSVNRYMNQMNAGLIPQVERETHVPTIYFDWEKYEELTAATIESMVSEGWELISRTFSLSDESIDNRSDRELVIGAIAPEEIGRHAVLLYNPADFMWSAMLCTEMMLELYSRLPEITIEDPTDDSVSVITIIEQARAAVNTIRQNITQTRASVEARQREIDSLLGTVASQTRMLTDEQRQLRQMDLGAERLAMETVRDLATLPDLAATMRQIQSSELDANEEQMVLKLVTHPFGMRIPAGLYRDVNGRGVMENADTSLYIPPITISINFNVTSWSNAISFTPGDGNRWHPHVGSSNHPCWGSAATPLAEAWARRDWESFIRILLGWFTQYDPADIYTRVHTIIEQRGRAPRTGWLLPDEDGNVPQPVTDSETTEEMGEYVDDEDPELVETR